MKVLSPARISWWRRGGGGDGGRLYGDDGRGTLFLSRVVESDSGVYVCTASDGARVSVDEAQVIVVEAAEVGGARGGGEGTQGGEEETPWSIP